jgi:hypothetical protein
MRTFELEIGYPGYPEDSTYDKYVVECTEDEAEALEKVSDLMYGGEADEHDIRFGTEKTLAEMYECFVGGKS